MGDIKVMIPDIIDPRYTTGYGGMYCILRTDTWEIFRYNTKKTHIPVFTGLYHDGKLYESEKSAFNAAKRVISYEPELDLVVTYYGIAVSTYYKTALTIKRL